MAYTNCSRGLRILTTHPKAYTTTYVSFRRKKTLVPPQGTLEKSQKVS